jgi:hypothetical protein
MIPALIVVAVQSAGAELPTEQEIVVTGRRMRQVQIAASINRMTGKTRCRVTISSGDPRIDGEVCEIARACAQVKPRRRAPIEACVRDRKARFLRTYVPIRGTAQ